MYILYIVHFDFLFYNPKRCNLKAFYLVLMQFSPLFHSLPLNLFILYHQPRSSDQFYVVTYYIKWVTTSWTHSITLVNKNCKIRTGYDHMLKTGSGSDHIVKSDPEATEEPGSATLIYRPINFEGITTLIRGSF